jgi:RNA polymerase sigma-70 factor, ECF subfamily
MSASDPALARFGWRPGVERDAGLFPRNRRPVQAELEGRVAREGATTLALASESSTRSAPVTESDDVLMVRVGSGDQSAYRELSERHLRAILRYCARMLGDAAEAEDVVQETFLRLWQQAARYQPRGTKPSTWLYRIAHNLCIDRIRKRKPQDASALDRQSSGDRPGALLDRKEVALKVQAALASLPERQRAALVLMHYEGLSQLEAAEVLGCRVHALESLLQRARRGLREELARWYEHAPQELP